MLAPIKMKLKNYFILIFVTVFCSCNSSNEQKTERLDNFTKSNTETINEEPIITPDSIDGETEIKNKPDSILTFRVDDYPIKNEMFKGNYGLKKSGEIVSYDKVWFTNKSINQTLVFELYTDYHRIVTYHFDNLTIPDEFVNRMELHIEGGELATKEQKIKHLNGLIDQSLEINENKFVSEKGVSIGIPKMKAVEIYGEPDIEKIDSEFEILKWEFSGDAFSDDKTEDSKKPYAKDSFGHSVTMFFNKGHLVGQILVNDIP